MISEKVKVLVTQLCLILCEPVDSSPPGSSVHGLSKASILKWVAMSFSRDLPNPGIEPRSLALQADSLPAKPPGKPRLYQYSRTSDNSQMVYLLLESVASNSCMYVSPHICFPLFYSRGDAKLSVHAMKSEV